MAKSLEFLGGGSGDSLAVNLARRDTEREASECFKAYVVRSRLKRVSNKAVKCNAFAREEGSAKFPISVYRIGEVPRRARVWSNR